MPFGGLLTAGVLAGGAFVDNSIAKKGVNNATNALVGGEQQVGSLAQNTGTQANQDVQSGTAQATGTFQNYYNQNLGLLSPYMSSGTDALSQLAKLTSGGGFTAPTGVNETNDPGYQFRLDQGTQALQRSESSTGSAEGGAAAKELARYSQDYASNEYGNVYNRALGTYQTNFGNLQSLANLGLSATNTGVGTGNLFGSQTGSTQFQGNALQGSNLLSTLPIQANALEGAANARATGYKTNTQNLLNTVGPQWNNLSTLSGLF